MIATAYVQNGAKVYIASRKEKQLKEVCTTLFVNVAGLSNSDLGLGTVE